jgi:hypothetical protein
MWGDELANSKYLNSSFHAKSLRLKVELEPNCVSNFLKVEFEPNCVSNFF